MYRTAVISQSVLFYTENAVEMILEVIEIVSFLWISSVRKKGVVALLELD